MTTIIRTQVRNMPIGSRVLAREEGGQTPSLFGIRKGDSVQGIVREVRPASIGVELPGKGYGWAYGQGLDLSADEQPQDQYHEGSWVWAEVIGLDHGNECLALSIRSGRVYGVRQPPAPVFTYPFHLSLNELQRGRHLFASVQEVRETGLHVLAGDVPGWIDRKVANIPERETVADRYRVGQFIPVWVTGVNYEGGEFAAQTYPLSSPQLVTSNWEETIR